MLFFKSEESNFAKVLQKLVYVPEPLCAVSLFYEFSVNLHQRTLQNTTGQRIILYIS